MLDWGIKFVVLSFASFMHYIATMLIFFVPIDIAAKVFLVPQMPAILIGTFALWGFSMITAYVILRVMENKNERNTT
jgi:hypothetical protein